MANTTMCPNCDGKGITKNNERCEVCDGTGKIQVGK